MKQSAALVSAVLALGVVASPAALASDAPPVLPSIDILYPPGGSLLDRLCTSDFKLKLDEKDVQAAVAQRAALQKQWDTEGPAYLEAALTGIGLPFPYKEMQATLSVCLPASTSIPLIIDVRPFLPGAKAAAPAWEFTEVVFHELMHSYVRPVLSRSELMKKYANEPPTVKYHLHVMAVEKMVLLKLGRPDDLKTLDHDYRNSPDPAYKRAWEIVNDQEGYEPFIGELKAVAAATRAPPATTR